jgi:hypothetical protein
LPSGAVRLVRLSALTRSSIFRTDSLELDIGFLREVVFHFNSARAPQDHDKTRSGPDPGTPSIRRNRSQARIRCGAHPACEEFARMAFGMPETRLSRQADLEKRRK